MKKNKTTLDFLLLNCPQVLKNLYDWPDKYHFWRVRYVVTRLWNLVQLYMYIYSTRALFCRCFVVMKYRWICQFLALSESPPLMGYSQWTKLECCVSFIIHHSNYQCKLQEVKCVSWISKGMFNFVSTSFFMRAN